MGAIQEYFNNIYISVTTVFDGMAVTMSHMFRRPITVQYPYARGAKDTPVGGPETLPDRYRGFLEVDIDICTGCLVCARACPIDCINIEMEKIKSQDDPDAKPVRMIRRFDIDVGKCMYCGLCQEPCPTNALRHSKHFEATTVHLEHLVARFVDPQNPVVPFKTKKGVAYESCPHGSVAQKLLVDPLWDRPAVEFPKI